MSSDVAQPDSEVIFGGAHTLFGSGLLAGQVPDLC